ncbi:hypothetical protein [Burkholderia gladioli]|uniref:hypothetical protein n=1 Tax=Burkholderia gladioli TaxID=28095 RepID=UPI001FC818CA|nr:hypothetical protein [Burkholderia gladioli]
MPESARSSRSSDAAKRVWRVSASIPKAENASVLAPPLPSLSGTRPFDSTSSTVASSASRSGSSSGSVTSPVPSSMRRVRCVMASSSTSGEGSRPYSARK